MTSLSLDEAVQATLNAYKTSESPATVLTNVESLFAPLEKVPAVFHMRNAIEDYVASGCCNTSSPRYEELRLVCQQILEQQHATPGNTGVEERKRVVLSAPMADVLCLDFSGDEPLRLQSQDPFFQVLLGETGGDRDIDGALSYLEAFLNGEPVAEKSSGSAEENDLDGSGKSLRSAMTTRRALKIVLQHKAAEALVETTPWRELVEEFTMLLQQHHESSLDQEPEECDGSDIADIVCQCFEVADPFQCHDMLQCLLRAIEREDEGNTATPLLKVVARLAIIMPSKWFSWIDEEITSALSSLLQLSSQHFRLFSEVDEHAVWLESCMELPLAADFLSRLPSTHCEVLAALQQGMPNSYVVGVLSLVVPLVCGRYLRSGVFPQRFACDPSFLERCQSVDQDVPQYSEELVARVEDFAHFLWIAALDEQKVLSSELQALLVDGFYEARIHFSVKLRISAFRATMRFLQEQRDACRADPVRFHAALQLLLIAFIPLAECTADSTESSEELEKEMQGADAWLADLAIVLLKDLAHARPPQCPRSGSVRSVGSIASLPQQIVDVFWSFTAAALAILSDRLTKLLGVLLSVSCRDHSLYSYHIGMDKHQARVFLAASIHPAGWDVLHDSLLFRSAVSQLETSDPSLPRYNIQTEDLLQYILEADMDECRTGRFSRTIEPTRLNSFPWSLTASFLLQRWSVVSAVLQPNLLLAAEHALGRALTALTGTEALVSTSTVVLYVPAECALSTSSADVFATLAAPHNVKAVCYWQNICRALMIVQCPLSSAEKRIGTASSLMQRVWKQVQVINSSDMACDSFQERSLVYLTQLLVGLVWLDPSSGTAGKTFLGSYDDEYSVMQQMLQRLQSCPWTDPMTLLISTVLFSVAPAHSIAWSPGAVRLAVQVLDLGEDVQADQATVTQAAAFVQTVREALKCAPETDAAAPKGRELDSATGSVMREKAAYLALLKDLQSEQQLIDKLQHCTEREWTSFVAGGSSTAEESPMKNPYQNAVAALKRRLYERRPLVMQYVERHGVDPVWIIHLTVTQYVCAPRSSRAEVRRCSQLSLETFLNHGLNGWEIWMERFLLRLFTLGVQRMAQVSSPHSPSQEGFEEHEEGLFPSVPPPSPTDVPLASSLTVWLVALLFFDSKAIASSVS